MLTAKHNLLPIAQVLKSYGTQGEVIISIYTDVPEEISIKKPIFLFFEGLSVPFFIEYLRPRGVNKALLKLEDIDTINYAEEIVGKKLFLPSKTKKEGSDDFLEYTLFNQEKKEIGKILATKDFNGNICLEVECIANPEPLLIPFHPDLLISINKRKKTLTLNIPEGLV